MHRFYDKHGSMYIRYGDTQNSASEKAEWVIEADCATNLEDLVQSVRHYVTLSKTLKSEYFSPEGDKQAGIVLGRLKSAQSP